MMNRLLCYAHYDELGNVKPFVKYALKQYSCICNTLVFVSNSPLAEEDMQQLQLLCDHVIINANSGYDFCMWKSALKGIDYTLYDEIVLANSSVYGPIATLEPIFDHMNNELCDFWGITENFNIEPHIQSYFLVFKKRVILSNAFDEFWNSVLPYSNKRMVIMSYEVGLSQWLIGSGFEMGVYCGFDRLKYFLNQNKIKMKVKSNPSVRFAVELLKIGSPFLKREPIKKKSIDMNSIVHILRENSYPVEFIDEYDWKDENRCPVCGSTGKLYYKKTKDRLNLYNVGRYNYYSCSNAKCRVLWLHPPLSFEQIKSTYKNYYTHECSSSEYLVANNTIFNCLTKYVNFINKTLRLHKKRKSFYLHGLDKIRPGKLLEIGCGSGDRLVSLKEIGWEVAGQEVDPKLFAPLRQKGINVIEGDIISSDLEDNQFDAILLSHVIEHVSNIKELLVECRRLLKPGGGLYVSTPNARSLTHLIFGKNWRGLEAPRHFVVFTPTALKLILTASGFNVIQNKTVALNTEIFVMHSLDILVDKWTDTRSAHRLGRELLPVTSQMVGYIINMLTGKGGDECFAIATKRID